MKFVIRNEIQSDVFGYLELTDVLSRFANVRGKIHRLLENGEIVRVKKGLYTFPSSGRHAPLNLGVVANLIYGPSYVSSDFALAYYGLIPEKVEEVTSITNGRPRFFKTPVGNFSYASRLGNAYPIGVTLLDSPTGCYQIALQEKALYDKVLDDPRFDGRDIASYLWDDLRIDPERVFGFSRSVLESLLTVARGRMRKLVHYLIGVVNEHRY